MQKSPESEIDKKKWRTYEAALKFQILIEFKLMFVLHPDPLKHSNFNIADCDSWLQL